MDVKDCLKERILRRTSPSLEKTQLSIKIAESKLEEAKKLFAADFFNNSVLSAYTSMFHVARALLYKDGIQEKSHFAVCIYLNEKYSNKIPKNLLNSFNVLRENRHRILYGIEQDVSKEDAESAVLDSEDFLMEIKKILENKNG